jgi:very-short-patch-repair endonuclease
MEKSIARSRELRQHMTPPEAALWTALRRRSFGGAKFRRQAPIGPYFADFACFDPKLIVEVDGASHDFEDQIRHDLVRTAYLERSGFRVIRFAARAVLRELPDVCDSIAAVLAELRAI